MIPAIVRKILEIYLQEKRIIGTSELSADSQKLAGEKDAVFLTLYYQGKVIASTGRIMCLKENTLAEIVDHSFFLLKDARFSAEITSPEMLADVRIRADKIGSTGRRMLQNVNELNVRNEGIIFLSQNLGKMSVILPNMINLDPTPEKYFNLVCRKANIDPMKLTFKDYVLYGLSTAREDDFL